MSRLNLPAMAATLVLAACGGDSMTTPPAASTALLPGFAPPAPRPGAFQMILPIVKDLPPGADVEMCTWTDRVATEDFDIKAVQAYQSPGGHHVVLFATTVRQPPGLTRPCTDDDMATFRFAAGAGGEGQDGLNMAPGNLVYRVQKGAQIVYNHHYINASPKPHDAQSAINVYPAASSPTNVPSSSVAFVNTNLALPPGKSALDIDCTMKRDVKTWFFIPHMHHWGTHIVVEHTTGGATQRMFDLDWKDEYQFHPPEKRSDPATPFVLAKGDKVHVRCEWNNTEQKTLGFGLEMCVAFAASVDDQHIGNIACDAGEWTGF